MTTWNDLIEKYKASSRWATLSAKSQETYDYAIDVLEKYVDINVTIDTFNRETCDNLISEIREIHGDNTANSCLRFAKLLFNFAIDDDILEVNYFTRIKAVKIPSRNVVWKQYYIKKMITYLEKYDTHLHRHEMIMRMGLLAYFTANRLTDIRLLKWENVKEDGIYITQGKTDEYVWIPMTDDIKRFLPKKDHRPYVFSKRYNGDPYEEKDVSDIFGEELRAMIGIPKKYVLRDMRRNAITHMMDNGATDAEIMSLSGHKNVQSMEPYRRIHGRKDNKAAINATKKLKWKD